MNATWFHQFIFSNRYRFRRHLIYWSVHIVIWTLFWYLMMSYSLWQNFVQQLLWLPVFIIYSYPLMYWVVPRLLLKGKFLQFIPVILLYGVAGLFLNYAFRRFLFIPAQEAMHFEKIVRSAWQPGSFLLLIAIAAITSVLKLFKHWQIKQSEWMQAEKDKVTAELELLKAQVHPHFLFNTLNNIYSFSMEHSPKTPGLILKLSSLLSYMLYDCKAAEVPLEKEIDIMKNYIDLEKERYGNRLEISWNVDGQLSGYTITPLLMLPFLENAFKHGTSEQLEKPWLSVDLAIVNEQLSLKIINSKNENRLTGRPGIGIDNVKKRLAFLYPGKHELKISDDGMFFVVTLSLVISKASVPETISSGELIPTTKLAL